MGPSKHAEGANTESSPLIILQAESIGTPDIVKYDGNSMNRQGFDLILRTNTLKEFGIVLNF
jgi:hypothetical protein